MTETATAPTQVGTMIEARSLTMTYQTAAGEVHALKGLDWTVRRGEAVAIMGPSGCGKSTLLNLVGAMDRPTGGDVIVEGQNVGRMTEREAEEYRLRRVGFIFQFFNLLPTLSVAENLELPMIVSGVDERIRRRRIHELLDSVNLAAKADKRTEELSGGEQQRIATCIALVNDPDLILADEPTGNLDGKNLANVRDLLISLATERGKTVVVTSHDMQVVNSFPTIYRMRDGLFESDG